jgi:hypothetical protein
MCTACAPAVGVDAVSDGAIARTLPVGYGTLRQEDFTVSIRAGDLLVRLTPLDEAITLLAAPDTHARLRALREGRLEEAPRHGRAPELFLVSFFSYQPDVPFQPEDVQLLHQSRLLRPTAILPITMGWGRQRLERHDTQMAVYVFDGPIVYEQAVTARYGSIESDEWRVIMMRLEQERGRIMSRVR